MKKVMYNNSELSGSFGQENTPIGTILMYGGTNLPFGYMWCNGSAVSRTVYSDLFNAIGTAFGSGDGSTTFNLPTNHSTSPMKDIIKFCKAIYPAQEQFIDDSVVSAEKTFSSAKISEITRDWALVSGGTNTRKTLPNDWRELIIVAYDNSTYTDENVCYQFHVTREMVLGKVHRFYSGYTYTTSDYGGARVDVTETTVTLQWFKFSGATKNALLTVRYR